MFSFIMILFSSILGIRLPDTRIIWHMGKSSAPKA